jgi:hypothetical protein
MKRYICKERIDEKRTRVKIISKEGRIRIGVEHIGVAHNEEDLKMFIVLAQERLRDKKQQEFKFSEFEEEKERGLIHKKSYSKFLYEILARVYGKLEIDELSDEIFKQIVLARIIRSASKMETVEIFERLGLEFSVRKRDISLFKEGSQRRLPSKNI